MMVRDLVLYNLRWKLTALLLAMLVWFGIRFAIYREVTGGRNQVVRHQPVHVLKTPDDLRTFRIDPTHVDVVVQANREVSGEDLEVFLNLATMPDVPEAKLRQVLVRVSGSARVVRVEPPFIVVERAAPSESFATNPLRKQ